MLVSIEKRSEGVDGDGCFMGNPRSSEVCCIVSI